MAEAPLLLRRRGAIARITLNRPDVGNAIDLSMARALKDVVFECANDAEIRCVLLTGAGKFFCAGGDVAEFSTKGERLPAHILDSATALHDAILLLARMNKPLVTAINGYAAGAGVGLAIVGDLVLASSRARFSLAYSKVGMTPDGGATWLLPRLIGWRRAQELCLLSRTVDAEEAAAIGLVTRVVDNLDLEAEAVANELARGATGALGGIRRLLLVSGEHDLETQLDSEGRAVAMRAMTRDGREGFRAFMEKRAPVFEGRD